MINDHHDNIDEGGIVFSCCILKYPPIAISSKLLRLLLTVILLEEFL